MTPENGQKTLEYAIEKGDVFCLFELLSITNKRIHLYDALLGRHYVHNIYSAETVETFEDCLTKWQSIKNNIELELKK